MSAFRIMGILGLDGAQFFRVIGRAQVAMGRFGQSIASSVGSRLAAAFSFGAISMFAKSTIDLASSLVEMSARTGVSVEALQRFNRVAVDTGTNLESLVGFWEKLSTAREKALKDPLGSTARAFSRLGIGSEDLRTKTNEDLTRQIALKFKGAINVEELIAPLREVGGRGAGELVMAFRQMLEQSFNDLQAMTTATAEELDALKDSFAQFTVTLKTLFAPVLVKIMEFIRVGAVGIATILKTAWTLIKDHRLDTKHVTSFLSELQNAAVDLIFDKVEGDAAKAEARKRKGELSFDDIVPDKKTITKASAPYSDALVAVGNFLGTNQASVGRVAERQLEVLHRIERNTRRSGFATSTWGDPSGFATTSFDAE